MGNTHGIEDERLVSRDPLQCCCLVVQLLTYARYYSDSKPLAALVAILALLYNGLFAVICQYLPDDPLYLGVSITGYAYLACGLSILGLVGILTVRTLLTLSHRLGPC
jgi:hypothetical protein